MHTLRNRILFFGSAAAAGLAALGLHGYMLEHCIDEKGLLIAGNLPGKLLWVLCLGFAAVLGFLLTTIGGDGSYEDNFPRCRLSGSLMIAAGAALAVAIPTLVHEPGLNTVQLTYAAAMIQSMLTRLASLLPYGAVAAMVILGVCRMTGRKPSCLVSGLVCLFFMMKLVNDYRLWSADPKFYSYVFPMLAGVLLMLCSFHRTCCDAGIIQRRKLLFTGLSAAVCCTASLSIGLQSWFYIAGGLWAAGSMCNPAVLPPDPKEEADSSEAPVEE